MRGVTSNFPTESYYILFKDFWSKTEINTFLKPLTQNKQTKKRSVEQLIETFMVFKPRQYDLWFWLYQPFLVGSAEQNFT